jgi:hypothetical protein
MDIHKPKPWHGVREFLKEYVIIVVGVLTALGAEQGVEWLHWQEKVHRGEAQESAELSSRYADAAERAHVEKCLDARLNALAEALLARDGPWTPLPPMDNGRLGAEVLAFPDRPWSEGVWRSLVADGTANHLDERRARLYAATYAQLATMRDRNMREVEEVSALSVLQHATVLTRPERNALVETIERERYRNHVLGLASEQTMRRLERMIAVDPKPTESRLKTSPIIKDCTSLGLPT